MKYSIRPTPEPEKKEPPEKEVEFYLQKEAGYIKLCAEEKGANNPFTLLMFFENGEEAHACALVSKSLGIKVNSQGKIIVT